MRRASHNTPNTHLGEVIWWIDSFFGNKLWLCQAALGMREEPYKGFLDAGVHAVSDLWEYFEQFELKDGRLGLFLYLGQDNDCLVATIHTTLRYGEEVSDQVFLNLIEDFTAHVRQLPLIDPEAREGALWTDADIAQGWSDAENKTFIDALEGPAGGFLVAGLMFAELADPAEEDEIPF